MNHEASGAAFGALYERHWGAIRAAAEGVEGLEGPFLASPSHGYGRSATRLVVVGQQTAGWVSGHDVEKQMHHYAHLNAHRPATYFWRAVADLEAACDVGAGDSAWLNLNRYDQCGSRPKMAVEARLESLDGLLLEELQLLAPDVLVFLTGPGFDERLARQFCARRQPCSEGIPERALARLSATSFPPRSFRMYHPRYLSFKPSLRTAMFDALRRACTAA